MNPSILIETVKTLSKQESLSAADTVHMQRYFLFEYTDLTQAEIAELTNCTRSNIFFSKRKMKSKEYDLIRTRMNFEIKNMMLSRRGYTWLSRN